MAGCWKTSAVNCNLQWSWKVTRSLTPSILVYCWSCGWWLHHCSLQGRPSVFWFTWILASSSNIMDERMWMQGQCKSHVPLFPIKFGQIAHNFVFESCICCSAPLDIFWVSLLSFPFSLIMGVKLDALHILRREDEVAAGDCLECLLAIGSASEKGREAILQKKVISTVAHRLSEAAPSTSFHFYFSSSRSLYLIDALLRHWHFAFTLYLRFWIFCIVCSMCFNVFYTVYSFASLYDSSKPFIWPHLICIWSHVHFEWLAMSSFSRTNLRGLSKRSWRLQAMLTTGFFLCMYRCELDASCSQVIAIYFCYCAYWTWHHWLLARSGSHGKGDSYLTFMLRV